MTDRLPHEKGFHVSWDQIHRDARALAWRLDGKGPGEAGAWKAVVGITRGGLVPAMIVSRELDIRVVDTISVKSYMSGGGKQDQHLREGQDRLGNRLALVQYRGLGRNQPLRDPPPRPTHQPRRPVAEPPG